jgi:RND family efflux transporter MFP subunit
MLRPESIEASARLLSAMLRERESGPRAQLLAQRAMESVSGNGAVVYFLSEDPPSWAAKAVVGEVHLEATTVAADSGLLSSLIGRSEPLLFSGADLTREDYAHLHARRTLVSLAYIPIMADGVLVGAVEIAAFDTAISRGELASLYDLVEDAGPGLVTAVQYEEERNTQLESISRLTQLYDLEKVFGSTLEMDELRSLITQKVREVMEVQVVNLWFVKDQDELVLMEQAGMDPTAVVHSSQRTGEGYIADVSDSGEPLLIDNDQDERLRKRNPARVDGGPFSVIACPLVAHEKLVGVIECINKPDGRPFDDDELFLLSSISETAAIALNNASLLQAERKVAILQTLVQVSGEITSTLNLDRVLQAVVNTPSAVIPYERASVVLDERGRLRLKAVSGMEQINPGAIEITQLENVIPFLPRENTSIIQRLEKVEASQEDLKTPFAKYFAATGMRAFYVFPLVDDEGFLGMLIFESSDPDFLNEAHQEMIRVLAGQATVAVRNASLYKEVPFIGLLEPILQRKQKFLALEKRRRRLLVAVIAVVVLFLAVFPFPMRIDGTATVAPSRSQQVQPEIDGVVKKVFVHEGQYVQAGQVLADLQDWDYRGGFAEAQAKLQTATLEMNRALNANDDAQAGIQQVQVRYWASEVERAKQRLDATHLRALISGWVTTPHVEDFVGRRLAPGETFAEIIDNAEARVDLAIDASEISLLHMGAPAALKVESFPGQTFHGKVGLISPESQTQGEGRIFYARIEIPNLDGRLRTGMQGIGKLSVGWRPIGYVLFRGPFLWIYSKLWSWFGW